MQIKIPNLSLVVLIGPSGSGKSTFARRHFKPTEILSSDACRGMVSDNENDQTVTNHAFEVLQFIAGKRLALGRLTVIDATNVQPEARKPLVELARQYHCLPVAIVLDLPEKRLSGAQQAREPTGTSARTSSATRSRNSDGRSAGSSGRASGTSSCSTHPRRSRRPPVERVPLWNDKRDEHGPFDIIGDVHGCGEELEELLARLGYVGGPPGRRRSPLGQPGSRPSRRTQGGLPRRPRRPRPPNPGHGAVGSEHGGSRLGPVRPRQPRLKLVRKLRGKNVQITHGLAETLAEIDALPEEVRAPFCKDLADFLDDLVSHYVLDDGKLVVAHAGMKEEMQGRGSGKVRDFALYGETTGETDEFGLPVRFNWAAEYRGQAMVVYGHTPVPEPDWLNRTVNIDTGCVFGGKLTAFATRRRSSCRSPPPEPIANRLDRSCPRRTQAPALSAQQVHDEVLDADDVLGKRIIPTRLRGNVTIREENATAALEVMSRFAADPRWLIYLPPTMSPCETSRRAGAAGAPGRGVRLLPQPGCPAGHLRREAHGLAGRGRRLPGRGRRHGNGSASTTGEFGIVYHPDGPSVLQRPRPGAAVPRPGAGGPRPPPTSGPSSTRRGPAWTAS